MRLVISEGVNWCGSENISAAACMRIAGGWCEPNDHGPAEVVWFPVQLADNWSSNCLVVTTYCRHNL
jgi:hypothetical protein